MDDLKNNDKTFKVEEHFFRGITGDLGDQKLLEQLGKCLPSPTRAMTIAKSVQLSEQLLQSGIAQYATDKSIEVVKSMIKNMKRMWAGDPPMVAFNATQTMKQYFAALQFFLRFKEKDDADEVFGKQAYQAMFPRLKDCTTFDALEPFVVHSYFGDVAQQNMVQAKKDELVAHFEGLLEDEQVDYGCRIFLGEFC